MPNAYPKKVTLNSGKVLEIRPLESKDEEALLSFFANLPHESTDYLKHDVRNPDVVKRFVRHTDLDHVWPIVALTEDGLIVSDATLNMHLRGWKRHIGEIRVVVAPAYQKMDLAKVMIHELVNQASMKGLKKLVAQVLDSQEGARRAFQHLGFAEEARLKDHAMDLDSHLHDLLILTNTVEDLWAKMEELVSDDMYSRDVY